MFCFSCETKHEKKAVNAPTVQTVKSKKDTLLSLVLLNRPNVYKANQKLY